MPDNLFSDAPTGLFDDTTSVPASVAPNDVTPRLVALNDSPNPLQAMTQQGIDLARQRLANGEEESIRLKAAYDRQQSQAKAVASLRDVDPKTQVISPEASQRNAQTYQAVVNQNIDDTAQAALERTAVDKINDAMAEGDPVEAKLINGLYFGRGHAQQVYADEAAKNLILAQKVSQLQAESGDETWAGKAYNLLTSFLPLNSNFARTGIVPGTDSNLKTWLLSGTSLAEQGDYLWNHYSPEQLAASLKDGGELDTALRSAGTTFGGFDPSSSAEILQGLHAQSSSDRMWSNVWSVADPLALVPFAKVASIPKTLVRLGARKAATAVATDAVEAAIRVGPDAGEKLTGVGAREAESHLETSAMNPSITTPHEVPLAVDVAARAERNRALMESIGDIQQVSRATNPAEAQAAIEAKVKELDGKFGQRIKNVETFVEDVPTGSLTPYEAGAPLPEQGNSLLRVRVTLGKKDGGFFSSAAAAMQHGLSRLGLTGTLEEVAGREIKEIDPEFSIVGYHGTAHAFDKFDMAKGGKLTDAKSARMAIFATDNPDIAWTYAVESAKDRAYELATANSLTKAKSEAAFEYGNLKKAYREKYGIDLLTIDWSDSMLREAGASKQEISDFTKARLKNDNASADYAAFVNDTSVSGQQIRPVRIRMRNPYIHDYANELSNGYEENRYSEIIAKAKAEGHDGVILRNTDDAMGYIPEEFWDEIHDDVERSRKFKNHDIYAVFNEDDIVAPWDAVTTRRDVSGQFYAQADFHVPLDGFTTTPMNTPANGIFRWGRSAARVLDRDAQSKAVAAAASGAQLQAKIAKLTKEALKPLTSAEHGNLDAIMRAGQNKDVWLKPEELDIAWERLTGQPTAPERVKKAYQTYQDVNDIDFFARRNEIYRRDANAGRENVKFSVGRTGVAFDGTARVVEGGDLPTGRVFDASKHFAYNKARPLRPEEWERMKGEGYVLVETKEPIEFPDGLRSGQFVAKSGDLERSTLKLEKGLGYKAGGHRAYTGRHYIKQAVSGVQPDDGSEYLMNPSVWRTGNNRNRLQAWADIWNHAIEDYKLGVTDPQHYEDNIFTAGNKLNLSFPSGEDFIRGVESGRIDVKHQAEVVGDRELPSVYNSGRDDVDRFLDDAEGGDGGYFRSTGRMYTSARGDALLDESGEFAETVDPWQMTDTAISNIARMSSFSNYKDNVLERFKATYAPHLELRQLENASAYEMMTAKVRSDVDPILRRKVEAEQQGFAHIMNHETEFDKRLRARTRGLAEYVLGDAEGGARELGHDFVYWLSKNNPVNFLRALAFDAKLGMFNVGQWFLQSSTMAVATALSPRAGFRGMAGSVPLMAYTLSKGSDAVLDTLAKRGVWKVAGFTDEAEFKNFSRFMYRTGFLDVNGTHLSINDLRPTRYFGAANKLDAVREQGRAFFYNAEIMNRSVAGRIAWEELKAKGVPIGSAQFREQFIGLADDYSMNMTSQSNAAFQRGLWSIPTQFWGYNVRMMDAMFGNRFTKAQKARLILSQFALYGAGGVPVLDAVDEMVRNRSGASADAGSFQSFMSRGVLDNAIAAISGADVRVGERIGAGTFLTDTAKKTGLADAVNAGSESLGIGELLHVAEYDRVSLAELAGGATASISGAGFKTLTDVVKFGSVEGPSGDITRENLLKMADNVSTFSNWHKAYLADRFGIYKSQKGTVLGSDLPSQDAMWFALGLGRPQEADTAEFQKAYLDHKDQVVSEAATQIRNWQQEAFSRPDMVDENANKQWTLLSMYPPDVQQQIMKRTRRITDKSFFAHVQSQFDRDANQQDQQ